MQSSTTPLPTRRVGAHNVGCLGFGAMGLAANYGTPAEQGTVDALLDECLARGVTMIDTADIYSPQPRDGGHRVLGYNERQIAAYLASRPGARNKMFLCSKFGHVIDAATGSVGFQADYQYVLDACAASLDRLGVDTIDLYYAHRADPNVDVAETARALKELQRQGKIRYIGVSEYTTEQLKRANDVVHIDAVQIEVSPWTPDVLTNGMQAWSVANNTALVAYSPLGRGFLTGQYKSIEDFEFDDMRRFNPRFQGANFDKNLELVRRLDAIAHEHGRHSTSGQVALAWLLAKADNIIPIPGTKKSAYLTENIDAALVHLSAAEVEQIDTLIRSFDVSGPRYGTDINRPLGF